MAPPYTEATEASPTEASPLCSKLTLREKLRDTIQRHRLHGLYTFTCAVLATLSALQVYFSVLQFPVSPWFVALEILLTAAVVLDTAADMVVYGCDVYWQSGWHICEFVICVVCVINVPLEIVSSVIPVLVKSNCVTIIRYSVQCLRLFRFVCSVQKSKMAQWMADETIITMP